MSLYGSWVTGTITAGGTSTGVIDLGRDFDFLEVVIPLLISGTLQLQTSETTGGTYTNLDDTVTHAATTGEFNDVWALGGWQFIKIVSGATQTATNRVFRVRGMRY